MMKKCQLVLIFLPFFCSSACAFDRQISHENQNVAIVKNMFHEFAEKKDISKLDQYYSKNFVLESNGQHFSYKQYKDLEGGIYKTLKSLKVTHYYDIFASQNKVAARMSIKLVLKNGKQHEFQVMMIALIKNHKIAKLWELTYPAWSDKLPR
jgi:ketosteroid isomerase-like protein